MKAGANCAGGPAAAPRMHCLVEAARHIEPWAFSEAAVGPQRVVQTPDVYAQPRAAIAAGRPATRSGPPLPPPLFVPCPYVGGDALTRLRRAFPQVWQTTLDSVPVGSVEVPDNYGGRATPLGRKRFNATVDVRRRTFVAMLPPDAALVAGLCGRDGQVRVHGRYFAAHPLGKAPGLTLTSKNC